MDLNIVVKRLVQLAPLEFAESWDNVGLLVEARTGIIKKLLLTNDLTPTVMQEAIDKKANIIVSYHPPIFTPITKIRRDQWKEQILLQSIEHNIAIFSPHTTWDSMANGVNDWLLNAFPSRTNIKPIVANELYPSQGMGRMCKLSPSINLEDAISLVKYHLSLNHLRLGLPLGTLSPSEVNLANIAVCAGSGGSLFKKVPSSEGVTLYLSGEMSHHEVLDLTSRGNAVLLCEHSNSERGFLKVVAETLKNLLECVEIMISESDADPLRIA